MVLELPNEREKQAVRSCDVNLGTEAGRLKMKKWINHLRLSLDADTSFARDFIAYKDRLVENLSVMENAASQGEGVADRTKWLEQDSVAVISGLLKFKYTCFFYSDRYTPSKALCDKRLRWFIAAIAGDGNDPLSFKQLENFTHKQCLERIVNQPRFCTTGSFHFYPIPTHSNDLTVAYNEALCDLGTSLFNNTYFAKRRAEFMSCKTHCNATNIPQVVREPLQVLSKIEMTRMENIRRNNEFLTQLGLGDVKKPDVNPLPTVVPRRAKIPKKQIPTTDQMTLVGTTFTDDEDRAKSYRVVDVKFSFEYDVVCCFCIPYSEAAKNANEDDLVFDCDYVKKNCNRTGDRFHVEESEGDCNESDADDDY